MVKAANLNIRIDPAIKASAEKSFASFGITITDAVNIFLHKSIMDDGLPSKSYGSARELFCAWSAKIR